MWHYLVIEKGEVALSDDLTEEGKVAQFSD